MVDAAGTTKYTYTAAGQVLTEAGSFANDTVTNTYLNRLRMALSLQQSAGVWTNGFGYDAAGRLTNVVSQAGSFVYSYPAGSASRLPLNLLLPNTAYITNTYDSVARLLTTKLVNSSGTTLDSALYGYNQASQRTTYTNAAGTYVQYSYDPIGQLKVAASSVSSENRGYAYDPAWNLAYRTNNGSWSGFTVDNKNQLVSEPGYTDTYDYNGNLVTRYDGYYAAYSYSYDDENRLTSAVYNDPNVGTANWWRSDFVYDGLGRCIYRYDYNWDDVASAWNLSGGINHSYDGMRVIRDATTAAYTRGLDLSGSLQGAGGIGGLLARSEGYSPVTGNWATHQYYHADGNGNITYLLRANQTLAASYRYDPFGNTLSQSGSWANANVYRFSSKEVHLNSGMYNYGYRFYDPSVQRWLNRDPLGDRAALVLLHRRHKGLLVTKPFEEFDRQTLYEFCDNTPITEYDFNGLIPLWQLYQNYQNAVQSGNEAMQEYWADEIEAYYANEAEQAALAAAGKIPPPAYVICLAVIGAASVGAIIGTTVANLPVIGGGTVSDWWGDTLGSACPSCWNWVFW